MIQEESLQYCSVSDISISGPDMTSEIKMLNSCSAVFMDSIKFVDYHLCDEEMRLKVTVSLTRGYYNMMNWTSNSFTRSSRSRRLPFTSTHSLEWRHWVSSRSPRNISTSRPCWRQPIGISLIRLTQNVYGMLTARPCRRHFPKIFAKKVAKKLQMNSIKIDETLKSHDQKTLSNNRSVRAMPRLLRLGCQNLRRNVCHFPKFPSSAILCT